MEASPEHARHLSVWLDRDAPAPRPRLDTDRRADVAVVGAGITGLGAALMLAREGRSVIVVDQGRIGEGTTGHSTAKITSQHGLSYARIRSGRGADAARAYAEANEWAKEWIIGMAEGVDCELRRREAWVYATSADEREQLEREAAAAAAAGLPAELADEVPLPFATRGGLRFTDQAEFDPQRFVEGLARLLEAEGGEVFERTRASQVSEEDGVTVVTDGGLIEADCAVVATLMPFLDRGLFFARAFPTRSYALTARLADSPPEAMLINAGDPVRSIRATPWRGEELLMVGGESHHVGGSESDPERYRRLAEFAREHWQVESFEHRWSAQDYSPDDGVPYVGRLHLRSESIWIATGLKKWGITGGTAAARMIADGVCGHDNPWAAHFSSLRVKPLAEAQKLLSENAKVALHFFGDRLAERGDRPIADLAPGEGAIVTADGDKVAGYRDDDGNLHAVSARCTHLYCQLRWNSAERSWDCPCHGSRFSTEGEVLNGPAVEPLERRETGEPQDRAGSPG